MNVQATELGGIEHLILLDLLGAKNPLIRSYFLDTAWLFDAMVSAEKRIGDSGAFSYGDDQSMAPGSWRSWFVPRETNGMNFGFIGDDHVPFLHRGVSILHVIAMPFPHVWHTLKVGGSLVSLKAAADMFQDDASALDLPTLRRWNILLRVFMSEYLNLRPSDLATRSDASSPVQRSDSELVSLNSSSKSLKMAYSIFVSCQ